ncbi:[FeFe] hydrogenase H-cluster maturation GTPase HydF [Elusimicrobium simillimum]|uniref:[FeFe] hydrogenase H-cluster maturation GTPase HydF n=1 Tax=Elusimicrobium simillimum TaxID=3143438 RepID=UPI003C6F7F59
MAINKPHIGIFGRMNVGKSSIFNALAGQETVIVDDTPGTTTDPIKKVMEIEGLGPIVLIDTGGLDDNASKLGERRVKQSKNMLDHVDLAILVFAGNVFTDYEQSLMASFVSKKIPFFLIHNKSDQNPLKIEVTGADILDFSAKKPETGPLFAMIKKHLEKASSVPKGLLDGMVKKGDTVLLITPIDASAPAGRMILPQMQTLRAALDLNAVSICVQPAEVEEVLAKKPNIALAVTDSQVFAYVSQKIPPSIPLTSFSILLARTKGNFKAMVKGTKTIPNLKDGNKVLILESCTHTVNHCVDIGRTKLPNLLQKFTGKKLEFTVVAGLEALPEDLSSYALAIQCGGCMITDKQLQNRINNAMDAGVAISNYGMAIAFCNGIFERVLRPLL